MEMSTIELGVFMPVANNGWIISKNSPQYYPSFEMNMKVGQLAEAIGFDRIFSMAKWKNFGGEVGFWRHSLESLILMASLGAVTKRIQLATSVLPSLIHPAVYAKMVATADDVCSGRMAINLVHEDLTHLGLQSADFESYRYEYTEEWLEVVKKLWSEEKVNHQGKHFSLKDCESFPKPKQNNPSIILATGSEWGYDFVGRECDEALIGGFSKAGLNANSLKVKEMGKKYGRKVKTTNYVNCIMGTTDAEANEMFQHYWEGADLDAINRVNVMRNKPVLTPSDMKLKYDAGDFNTLFYGGYPLVGGPETIADFIENLSVNGQFDSVLFTFPDFVQGLTNFGKFAMPILREKKLLGELAMQTVS